MRWSWYHGYVPKPRKHIYSIGDTVGQLTVTDEVLRPRPDGRNRRLLVVQCSCGTIKTVLPSNLSSGDTKSCGCHQRKQASLANIKHGAKAKDATTDQKRLLSVWRGMKSRCTNPNARNYKWYGGKGIGIEWSDFESFYTWAVSHGYTEGLELDRIDPALNYSPTNCMWCSKSDNIARAHLKIDDTIKIKATALAQSSNVSFSSVIENALRVFLDAREEV